MKGWFGDRPGGVPPIVVIGYDGSPFSDEARVALESADLVVGGARHLEAVVPRARAITMGPVDPAVQEMRAAQARGQHVVVLASGDPGLFGIVRMLTAHPHNLYVEVLPAKSSIAAAFARLGQPWDDAIVVSAHGRPVAPALNVLRRYGGSAQRVAILTDVHSSPARIVEALGEDCPALYVFERLGEVDEVRTLVGSDAQSRALAVEREWASPNLVVTADAEIVPAPVSRLGHRDSGTHGWALPDESFLHRDAMVTKREIRAVVLARLAPAVGTLIWDVGAGSGSVAAECARLGSAVLAVEREPERNFLGDNVRGLGVKVIEGTAPEVLKGLPQPDAVFVGGGGPEVVAAVAAVRPERVVVTLATIERVAPTVAALVGYAVDTVLLQVQHLSPLGEGHRLAPANPVFVISGVLS